MPMLFNFSFHPFRLPEPELPRFDIVNRDVIQDAFILSMISYAAALSLSKIYAKKHHYTVRANQVSLKT